MSQRDFAENPYLQPHSSAQKDTRATSAKEGTCRPSYRVTRTHQQGWALHNISPASPIGQQPNEPVTIAVAVRAVIGRPQPRRPALAPLLVFPGVAAVGWWATSPSAAAAPPGSVVVLAAATHG